MLDGMTSLLLTGWGSLTTLTIFSALSSIVCVVCWELNDLWFIFVVAYLRRSKRSYLYFYHIWCFRLLWLWVWWVIYCIFFVILRWSFSFIGSGREVDINCFVVCKQYFIRVVDCIIILDERVMFKGILLVRLICLWK